MSSRDTRVYREVNTGETLQTLSGDAGVRLTLDQQVDPEIVERELRLLVERARLLSRGVIRESYSELLAIRIRPTIKKIWLMLPLDSKKLIRRILENLALSMFLGERVAERQEGGQPIIINMNINENKVDVRLDMRRLEEVLEELREIAETLERSTVIYKAGLRNYAKKLKKIASVIEDVKDRFATN